MIKNVKTRKKGLLFTLLTSLLLGGALMATNSKAVVETKAAGTTVTVTRSDFSGPSEGYAKGTWSKDGISGEGFIYFSTKAYIQINTKDTSRRPYPQNNTPTPGPITNISVTMPGSGTVRSLTPRVNSTAAITVETGGSALGTKTFGNASATLSWDISAADNIRYFHLVPGGNTNWESFSFTYAEELAEFGELTGISVNTASAKLTYNVEDEFSSAGITASASDNSDPVVSKTVTDDVVYSAEGHIFVAEDVGTYTVTVSYTELETTVSTTFDVEVLPPIVFDHAGTLEDPYSPADAIKVAEKTGETATTESFYIKGIISLVKSVNTTNFGNAEFEIKENLSDSVKFLIFRAFANSAGAPFTTETAADIKVGYEVVVYGKIVNYKGNTPETDAGTKNEANTTHVVSIDKTAATEAANAFAVNFNSAIGAICSLDGESDLGALEAEWLVQKAAFNALVEGSRVLVKASAANSEGSDLEQFTAKYIYIANKYQSLENFVSRTEVVAGVNDTVRNTNSNQMGYSLVIGLIGLTTLVGFYFINKKKQINN